jgi:hypothetical protein
MTRFLSILVSMMTLLALLIMPVQLVTAADIPVTYVITATAGAGGTISPSGIVTINSGASQSFRITPNTNYIIAALTVDNSTVPAVDNYTFTNVITDHIIAVSFTRVQTYLIQASVSGGHGSVAPSSQTVKAGENATINITPNSGYHIDNISDNGKVATIANPYIISSVGDNHTVVIAFGNTYLITAIAGPGGSITPSDNVTVIAGASQSFRIIPNNGFHTTALKVDNATVPMVDNYTFTNVKANHSIEANFGLTQVPPSVTTNAATQIKYYTATLNVSLTKLGTESSVMISFEYGLTTGYGSTTAAQTQTATGAFTANLTKLTANTLYHYRAKAVGSVTVYGQDMTFTTAQPIISNGGGGGGSGGSGSGGGTYISVSLPPGYTELKDFVNWNGIVINDAAAVSTDRQVVFFIGKGTRFLTFDGNPVTGVTITPRGDKPTPPAGSEVIGLCYILAPEGAIFDKAATLTMGYSGLNLGTFSEKNLATAYWDNEAKRWVKLSGCVVDTIRKTVTSWPTHFSTYAILGYPSTPAAFTTSNLGVLPAIVEPGKDVTVTINVTNSGELSGIYTAILQVNDKAEATSDSALNGGETKPVSFTLKRNPAGIYNLRIGNLSGNFTVLNPATYTASNLTISPNSVEAGQNITISFTVTNSGEMSGTYPATLQIEGVTEPIQEFSLAGGESRQVTFSVQRSQPGIYSVAAGDLSGSFVSLEPAVLTTGQPTLNPANIQNENHTAYAASLTRSNNLLWLMIAGGVVLVFGILLIVVVRRRSTL